MKMATAIKQRFARYLEDNGMIDFSGLPEFSEPCY